MTEDAMKAGAKGITYGRNIFAHKTPELMVQALAGIIREDRHVRIKKTSILS